MLHKIVSNTVNRLSAGRGLRRLVTATGGLALATLAAAPLARADITTPMIGGLPWRSGATSGGFPCLAQLRGRSLDALNEFIAPNAFTDMVKNTGTWLQGSATRAPLLVVSLALLPRNNAGQFAQCAAGAFDDYFRQVGANLQRAPAQGVVVRLGWEANIGSDSHPWGVDTADQVPLYVQCWRHAALALKAGGPRLNIEWTSAKKTQNRALSLAAMYPGDDVVDVIGVHYYDSGPEKNTQALWDKYYGVSFNGWPWGLGAWLQFARSHGKKLGLGEWGLWDRGQGPAQADDPVYIDNMYRFFRDNAADIAYETYLNGIAGQHPLCPGTTFPRSTAQYQADWSLGQ
ncbi:MAG TPA: hypothetical protein VGC92_04875 [Phenylobacterium sp.]